MFGIFIRSYFADVEPAPEQEYPGPAAEGKETIAEFLDKQLENEFRNEEIASQTKTDLNETLSKEKVSTHCVYLHASLSCWDTIFHNVALCPDMQFCGLTIFDILLK